MTPITGTLAGKHDIELGQILNREFVDKGIDCHASFERRRGRIVLTVAIADREKAEDVLFDKHYDFQYSYESSRTHKVLYLVYKQI